MNQESCSKSLYCPIKSRHSSYGIFCLNLVTLRSQLFIGVPPASLETVLNMISSQKYEVIVLGTVELIQQIYSVVSFNSQQFYEVGIIIIIPILQIKNLRLQMVKPLSQVLCHIKITHLYRTPTQLCLTLDPVVLKQHNMVFLII